MVLSFVSLLFLAFAQAPVVLAPGEAPAGIEAGLEAYVGDGAAPFEAVAADSARFEPISSLYPAENGQPTTYWARVRLRSASPERTTWILPLSVDEVRATLLRADGTRQTFRTGRHVPLAERPSELLDPPGVEIELEPAETATLYLQIRHRIGGYDDPIEAVPVPESTLRSEQRRRDGLQFLFIGITIALAFYNLFLYVSFRDPSYLAYVLFLAFSSLHWASHEGYLTLFLPGTWSPVYHLEWGFFALVFAALAYTQFARLFLHTVELAPRLDRALQFVLVGWAASGVMALFGAWNAGPTLAALFALFMLAATFAAGVQSHRRGFRPARYYLLASGSFIFFGIGYTVAYLLGMEVHGIGRTVLQSGMLMEMLLFAVALSVRIRILNTERADALAAREAAEATSDALREANDLKTQLLGIAAHDLRSPLTGIVGFSDLIDVEAPDRPDLHEFTTTIRRSAMRMLRLIEDLLITTALDGQRIELRPETVDLGALVRDLAAEYEGRVREKQQRLTLDLPPVSPFARVDPERFREIVDNLLSNAVKYTPPGGDIRLTAQVSDGLARVDVRDSGPGLSPDDQASLFQRFHRLTPTPTGGESSSGLGLSIAQELAQLHGGRIVVASRLGEGSTFSVIVPSHSTRLAAAPPAEAPA
ncbi:MAG TPA: hypothetical protein EYQ24_12310 [Bacteroidetes bacterium]|nr:hypothetical protein [Bacteroidota bacterium]HIL57176.1 hypothetical protein [Rhodothermales bacterium]